MADRKNGDTALAVIATDILYIGLHLALEAHAHAFRSPLSVAVWYPPLGLSLAYLICCGRNRWPVVALSYYLGVELIWVTDAGFFVAIRIALNNTLAVLLGAQILTKYDIHQISSWSLADLGALLLAAILCGLVSGVLALGYWHLAGIPLASDFAMASVEWMLGDMIGILLVTPLMLIIFAPVRRTMAEQRRGEVLASAIGRLNDNPTRLLEMVSFILATTGVLFWAFLSEDGRRLNLFYLCFLPVLWAVLRHGFTGAALTAIIIDLVGLSAILYFGAAGGMSDDPDALRYFQLFAIVLAIVAYTLGITVDRLKFARAALDRQSRDLENQVARRTRQLADEIDERKRIEDELRRLNDSLEQRVLARTVALNDARQRAERANEAKTQFLQNMSHELRTPLNAVIGFAQILHDELLGPLGTAKYRDYARDIVASGNHLLALVGDLLEIASLSGEDRPLRMERCSLSDIIEAARVMTEARAGARGVVLRISPPEPDISLMGDHSRIIQILVNLVSNAIKFAPEKTGVVEIEVRRSAIEAVVAVIDNGPGISSEDLPHVFDRFWRGSRSDVSGNGGMGLGLAIAKSLAERHGGSLVIESTVGRGTRAILRLPLLADQPSDA